MIAQALVEYGGLVGAVTSGIEALRDAVDGWLRGIDSRTALLVGSVVMVWLISRSFGGRRL